MQSIVTGLKTAYTDLISKNNIERPMTDISYQMVHDCAMYDTDFKVVLDFLTATSSHIKKGKITGEIVEEYKTQLKEMRNKGSFEKCDICFQEVYRLFDKQIDLMNFLVSCINRSF